MKPGNCGLRRSTLFVVLAAICSGLTASAGAQALLTETVGAGGAATDARQTVTVADDWQVICNQHGDEESCRMTTVGSGRLQDGRAITVQLASDARAGSGRVFLFLTPLDLLVAKGAEMRIDRGRTLKLAYRSCHAQGCVIPFQLSGALERSFRSGTDLSLRLFALDGTAVDVDLSLLGFIAASRAMESN
ncbi:MAG: invasion associated locus B family protein [Rhizobiaceae bacterium]|nr:invasion associated locus B family protein [Rhizobiaceae bacterium]